MRKEISSEYRSIQKHYLNFTVEDQANSDRVREKSLANIQSSLWFVPVFSNIILGGIFTIFRTIQKQSIEGVKVHIVIYDEADINLELIKQQIDEHVTGLVDYELHSFNPLVDSTENLPRSDIAFCTLWNSAYLLLKYNQTSRKFYFIQDYEPLFYPGGTQSALIEDTYRMNFGAIVNTRGLYDYVTANHDIEGCYFNPTVDTKIYKKKRRGLISGRKKKIFFYARPHRERNAFSLGLASLKMLKDKYGDKIEIITAGHGWNPSELGLEGVVEDVGMLTSLEDVAKLYRECDVGLCFMLSKHPSYQPFEFMASGVVTVTNINESNMWLYKDGENCIITRPNPSSIVEGVSSAIEDGNLRDRIVKGGYSTIESLGEWDTQMDKVWNYIKTV